MSTYVNAWKGPKFFEEIKKENNSLHAIVHLFLWFAFMVNFPCIFNA